MVTHSKRISRRAALASALASAVIGEAGAAGNITVIKAQDGRAVSVFSWASGRPHRGVILFSHGALSAPIKYERLLGAWAAAGFTVMAPLHTDSTDHPDHGGFTMADSWRTRLLDMRALAIFADVPSYVAAGHSYGALVALTLGGAAAIPPPGVSAPLRDPLAIAALAFSPPGPIPTLITAEGYAQLAVPAFVETGDRDIPPGTADGKWQTHLAAYDAAPPGDKYGLVLEGVDHYFGGLICESDKPGPPQSPQLATAIVQSRLFLKAFGAHDAAARKALDAQVTGGDTGLRRK